MIFLYVGGIEKCHLYSVYMGHTEAAVCVESSFLFGAWDLDLVELCLCVLL